MKKTITKGKKAESQNTDVAMVTVQDLAGKKTSEMEVSGLGNVGVSDTLIAQVIKSNRNRQRIRRAHTKGRGEVRGGGKKPWRQKGTGRARHASRRSPIWVGGGITFGPRAVERVKLFTPKEMRQKAIIDLVARHIKSGNMSVIETDKEVPLKTKELAKLIGKTERVLIITSSQEKTLRRSANNLKYVQVVQANQVTLENLMQAKKLWVLVEAIEELQQRCNGKIVLAAVKKRSQKKVIKEGKK